jgi:hypothetical protein
MIDAAPTVVPIPAAICGNSESVARTMACAEKPARASSAIARVGVVEEGAEGKRLSRRR